MFIVPYCLSVWLEHKLDPARVGSLFCLLMYPEHPKSPWHVTDTQIFVVGRIR